ncbi:hypothetical protein BT96DRAFT_220628 [Gymnopus androsaceus JB14]|uniref:Uncharacterized protein n=1 Tax=Gymnopus androsaceus JB14 TaxID=1447944 RepID=A0A6A4IB34_9AGAR|nr:hypothetical protein BT96DRAFT_220628 [Gymnopus androsaceus JB14]
MPDLTDSEAIEALFDSTSGHLAFSPSLNFSKQDTNTSYYHPKNSPVPFPLSTPKSSLSLAPHKHPLQQNTSMLNLAQNSNLDCYSSTNFAHSNPSQTPSFNSKLLADFYKSRRNHSVAGSLSVNLML